MRRALVAAAAVLALAAPAAAQTPPDRITIVSLFDPITFGQQAFVNGQLIGGDNANQIVVLQESPYPFTSWSDVAQQATDFQGYYSFIRVPPVTTHWRTAWNGGQLQSQEVQAQVAARIDFKAVRLNRTTVRFSGRLGPAHPDATIQIQRRTSAGWVTVANYGLHNGTTFAGRLHARRLVRLRAFFPSPGDVLASYSRGVSVGTRLR